MKIALVNLTKISDYAKESSYQADMGFLKENNIPYVDYCSDREDFDGLLGGFHEALRNPDIDIVWFIQGGTSLIKFIPSIDWDLVEKSNKKYLGISDFTHFSSEATRLGCQCFYGAPLVKVTKYWKTPEERKHIVDFLNTGTCDVRAHRISPTDEEINLGEESILGGHIIISSFMMSQTKPNLEDSILFLEHHYIPGETLQDLEFWLDQIKYVIRENQPKGFLLGHSMFFDEQENFIDFTEINKFLAEKLKDFGKPLYEIDHFKHLVRLSR